MFKAIASAVWKAANSPTGRTVLTLGVSKLVERFTKGSPKARAVIALTAHEMGLLAAQTGTKVDDLALEVVQEAVAPKLPPKSDARLVKETYEKLRQGSK